MPAISVEEDDEVDIGGIIQLVGAELAHAEHDQAGTARSASTGSRIVSLPASCDDSSRWSIAAEIAGFGKVAQPARRRPRVEEAGEVGKRNQEGGAALGDAQAAS